MPTENLPVMQAETEDNILNHDNQQQFLTFNLQGELFAIGILNIKEIIEYGHLTSVPMMPTFVRGVINLRGNVVPVIDLALRFGRAASVTTRRTCIVILEVPSEDESETQDIGIIVDSVSEVLDIATEDIEFPPTFGAKIRSDFIMGMGKIAHARFVIILNIKNVLSVEEMALLAQPHQLLDEKNLLHAST